MEGLKIESVRFANVFSSFLKQLEVSLMLATPDEVGMPFFAPFIETEKDILKETEDELRKNKNSDLIASVSLNRGMPSTSEINVLRKMVEKIEISQQRMETSVEGLLEFLKSVELKMNNRFEELVQKMNGIMEATKRHEFMGVQAFEEHLNKVEEDQEEDDVEDLNLDTSNRTVLEKRDDDEDKDGKELMDESQGDSSRGHDGGQSKVVKSETPPRAGDKESSQYKAPEETDEEINKLIWSIDESVIYDEIKKKRTEEKNGLPAGRLTCGGSIPSLPPWMGIPNLVYSTNRTCPLLVQYSNSSGVYALAHLLNESSMGSDLWFFFNSSEKADNMTYESSGVPLMEFKAISHPLQALS
uniref:Protein Ycf2-like n=1 Tax=Cucumis melo TaxID=3656 RepID=A0A9I9EJR9_CUCME